MHWCTVDAMSCFWCCGFTGSQSELLLFWQEFSFLFIGCGADLDDNDYQLATSPLLLAQVLFILVVEPMQMIQTINSGTSLLSIGMSFYWWWANWMTKTTFWRKSLLCQEFSFLFTGGTTDADDNDYQLGTSPRSIGTSLLCCWQHFSWLLLVVEPIWMKKTINIGGSLLFIAIGGEVNDTILSLDKSSLFFLLVVEPIWRTTTITFGTSVLSIGKSSLSSLSVVEPIWMTMIIKHWHYASLYWHKSFFGKSSLLIGGRVDTDDKDYQRFLSFGTISWINPSLGAIKTITQSGGNSSYQRLLYTKQSHAMAVHMHILRGTSLRGTLSGRHCHWKSFILKRRKQWDNHHNYQVSSDIELPSYRNVSEQSSDIHLWN